MRLATIQAGDGTQVALVEGERAFPVAGLADRPDPAHVLDLIEHPLTQAEVAAVRAGQGLDLASVRLRPPVLRTPKNIFCVGVNYHDHLSESVAMRATDARPEGPCWFTKPHTSLAAHGQPLVLGDGQTSIDFEGEVAAVMGRHCSGVSREEALDAVFGYTILNDISNRSLQREREQWFFGKGADGHAPCGPWVVTADEIGDPQALLLETRVNDVVRQRASTELMINSFADLIADLSSTISLEPGDIIAGGTPAGVGMATGEYLRPGDTVTVSVDGIGELHTPVHAR
jgi:2-keto-4-pentenoate hydratase/2-oxohepta-3-ene-1,7-dioic acid hydratase in catechol pathway